MLKVKRETKKEKPLIYAFHVSRPTFDVSLAHCVIIFSNLIFRLKAQIHSHKLFC